MSPVASVCVPWRPSPSRRAPYQRIRKFWADHFPGWPVIVADSDTEIFSLSQARNNAVAQAKTDVVVIADADTLIDPENIRHAVADPAGVWWPFTKYNILSTEYLDVPTEQLGACPRINTWDGDDSVAGVGGCIVTTRDEYWRLGGQPPEFCGWGWEDVAFTMVARTLSQVRRLAGCVYAFEHNDSLTYVGAKADSPGWSRDLERNRHLLGLYRAGDGRAWLMREIVAQRGEIEGFPAQSGSIAGL